MSKLRLVTRKPKWALTGVGSTDFFSTLVPPPFDHGALQSLITHPKHTIGLSRARVQKLSDPSRLGGEHEVPRYTIRETLPESQCQYHSSCRFLERLRGH